MEYEGRVILEFVVEKDGKVGRIKILRGLDKHVDAEAITMLLKTFQFFLQENNEENQFL